MLIAVGKVSFDDWDLFTSSFGWIFFDLSVKLPPIFTWHLFAITSLTFIFDCVPDPVCQTDRGKWSISLPSNISPQTEVIIFIFSLLKTPSSWFVSAAAILRTAKASIISQGIFSKPISKFSKDLWVCAPQNLLESTFISPIESLSVLFVIPQN